MASPNAAGVAALVRSYYPKLSAKQVKQILMDSGTPLPASVELGENNDKKSAADTSKSGKMINAYNALILADALSKNI
jgi:subtilisin family serine protease